MSRPSDIIKASRRGANLTEADRLEIIKRYKDGIAVRQLAAEYSIEFRFMQRLLNSYKMIGSKD